MKKYPVKNSLLIIFLIIILTACGLKGNPVPWPGVPDRKPVIYNMEALAIGEAVFLKWNFQDKKGLINYIIIERSEAGTLGNECKNCPRTYTKIGRIMIKTELQDEGEQREMSFTDTKAVKGKIYNYRLTPCGDNGNCAGQTTVEINF